MRLSPFCAVERRSRMNLDAAMRDLVREVIREEIRPLHETLRGIADSAAPRHTAADPQADDLLTVEQVATTTKVTEATVRTWIKAGALRASRPSTDHKPGRVYRVWRTDLEAFVLAARGPSKGHEINLKEEAASIVALVAQRRKP
jgi:excisionase family DNA binding protein